MKKIILFMVIISIVLIPLTKIAYANTQQYKYFFINKCEELEVKLTFKDGKPRGIMTLIDGARMPYNTWIDEYSENDDSYMYTIKRPTLGKWTIIIYGFTWDEVEFEIAEKNKEGHEYEERFGTPYIYTPVEITMRKHYIQLDTYKEEVEDKINKTFPDVQPSYWGTPYIAKLSYLNIINGRNGLFFPEDNVKVNEFLKMIICTMGYEVERNINNWALPYIEKAQELLLIEPNEYSDYNVPITREQASKMMVMATGLKEDLPDTNLVDKIQYDIKDYSLIDDYKKDDVLVCYAVGLITGIDGYFKPQNNLTRTQASTIIMRYIDRDMRQPYVPVQLRNSKYATLPNNQGELVNIYPGEYPEVIDAAIKLDEARKTSKGANFIRYLSEHNVVTAWFYKDIESKTRGISTRSNADIELLNMAIDIHTENYINHGNTMYYVSIYDKQETKELYINTLDEMFKLWFGNDYSEPYRLLTTYLDLNTNDEDYLYDFTFNSRNIHFTVSGGGIAIIVYPLNN